MRPGALIALASAGLLTGGAVAARTAPGGATAPTTAAATTAATTSGAEPVPVVRPRVGGAAVQGARLTASPGTWTGAGTLSYGYQWYRCDAAVAHCSSVHGATASAYRLVAADVGKTIALTVKATGGSGTTSGYASAIGPVAPAGAALYATAQPQLAGDPLVGAPLRSRAGAWSRAAPATAYTWRRCNPNGRICAPIAGATGSIYVPVAADVGHALVAAVAATRGGVGATALSVASAPVTRPRGPAATAAPSIRGPAKEGQRLIGASGTWVGSGAIRYAYRWSRCDLHVAHCVAIRGAAAAGYRLVARDVGKTIALAVRATDPNGTVTAYASALGPIAGAAAKGWSTRRPALRGKPLVGGTLRVDAGGWNAKAVSPSVAWLRCDAEARACVPVLHATAAVYAIQPGDAGHELVAVVTARVAGTRVSALSAAAGPVAASVR